MLKSVFARYRDLLNNTVSWPDITYPHTGAYPHESLGHFVDVMRERLDEYETMPKSRTHWAPAPYVDFDRDGVPVWDHPVHLIMKSARASALAESDTDIGRDMILLVPGVSAGLVRSRGTRYPKPL